MDKKFWRSHKFWAAIIAGLVAACREYGIDLPIELMWTALGYMGIRGVVDTGKAVATKRLEAPQSLSARAQWPLDEYLMPGGAEEVRMGSAKTAFQKHMHGNWEADNVTDPSIVEAAIIDYYEAQVSLAREMWREARGYYPEKIEEPCDSGDWSYESRWLWHSFRELTIQRDMLTAIKKNPAMGYQMGGVGYVFHKDWRDIPAWAQDNLKRHLKGYKQEFYL